MADHLFLPDSPPKPIRIEYSGPLYDGGDWDTFPTRCGWLDESGAETFSQGAIPSEYQSMMECWLYFGMLHYVFGDQLDQSDFVVREEGADGDRQYITTRHLQKYVEDVDNWKRDQYGARTVEIVTKVLENLPGYIPWIRPKMAFAIRLATLALWSIAIKRDDAPQNGPRHSELWFLMPEEAEEMIKEGWCPLDAQKCRTAGIQLDTQAYLLQLVRTKPSWNNRTHEICRKTECVADNIDESKYVTRHLQGDCTCMPLDADIKELHTILQGGGIPVVMITPSGEDKFSNPQYEIKVLKKRSSKPYVAISHVWADGLGNPRGNYLPHCQVEFLYNKARRLLHDKEYIPYYEDKTYGPLHTGAVRLAHFATNRRRDDSVLVWIDTLCIPHQPDVRSLAIQRIRDVYNGASRTLVLDSELMQVDSGSSSKLAVCLRVLYCSGWVRRLWTLQEAIAARNKLYVLLSDKAVNIGTVPDVLLNKVDKGEMSIFQEGIATMAAGAWYSYFQHPTDYASLFERLVLLNINQGQVISRNWFNVATRASSKDRDRATVLGGLLNLDLKKILAVKEADDRMRMLYSMLDEFPQDVLFLDGPRFDEDGMRWAMKVCRFTGTFAQLTHDSGKITPRGLQVTLYSSLTFPSCKMLDLVKFNQLDRDQRQSHLQQWRDESGIDSDSLAAGMQVLRLETLGPMSLSSDETYGVILRACPPDPITWCALVSLQETENGVQCARYISPGFIDAITLDMSELPEEGFLMRGSWDDAQKLEWTIC